MPRPRRTFDAQAEWAQHYDADEHLAVTRSTTPVLSPQTLGSDRAGDRTLSAHRLTRRLGHGAGGPHAKLGVSGPGVVALRKRLDRVGRSRPCRRRLADLRFLCRGRRQAFPGSARIGADGRRRAGNLHGAQCAGRCAPAPARDQSRAAARLFRQSRRPLCHGQYSGGGGRDRRERCRRDPSLAGVGKIDRQSPVMHDQGDRHQFQPVLDGARLDHPQGSDSRRCRPIRTISPRTRSASSTRTGRKSSRSRSIGIRWKRCNYRFRQDPGDNFIRSASCASISTTLTGSTCMTRRTKGIFGDDFRFISSGCIRVQNVRDYVAWLLEGQSGLGSRPYRRGDRAPASASTSSSPSRSRSIGSISPPGRRPTAWSSSATTSISATDLAAPSPRRLFRRRNKAAVNEQPSAAYGGTRLLRRRRPSSARRSGLWRPAAACRR